MKSIIKVIGLSLALAGSFFGAAAQQSFTYNQYMENLVPFNSAYSLTNPQGRFDFVARKQWVGIKGAPSTLMLDGYLPLGENGTATAGVMVMHDNVAVETQTEINGFVAKSVQISPVDYLALSLNLGARRYVTDFAGLDPDDPALATDIREIVPNVGFSVMLYAKDENQKSKYYFGVSVPRLNVRSLGGGGARTYLKNQFYITGGIYRQITEGIKIKPAVLISHSDNVPLQGDFSATVYLQEKLGVGLNYRTNREVSGLFTIHFNRIQVGYSYQLGFGAARVGSIGNDTHEIGVSYRLGDMF